MGVLSVVVIIINKAEKRDGRFPSFTGPTVTFLSRPINL